MKKELHARSDENGIPIFSNSDWKTFRNKYEKNDVRNALAEYIHEYKVPFPFKPLLENEILKLFRKFESESQIFQLSYPKKVDEKFDYIHKYQDNPLGIISSNSAYNSISNYFQQANRLSCSSVYNKSPIDIWNDLEKLRMMNWYFWRDGILAGSDICPATFRSAFRMGTYTATQFRPSVAKFMYEYHSAENILDTSCGWGDRLAGFYGTSNTKLYVGCDPNPSVFEVYKKQCISYEKSMFHEAVLTETEDYFKCVGSKTVEIWRKPAEDVNWSLYENTFDLYFTSPPYFNTEKYDVSGDRGKEQSFSRYPNFVAWRDDFLFNVIEQVWKTIRRDGYMAINIIDPIRGRNRYPLCDDMVEFCQNLPSCNYAGKLGMRMMARPNTEQFSSDLMIEPIWVFTKNSNKYDIKVGLESFME